MKKNLHLCIVIPAYNEEKKLDISSFRNFLAQNSLVSILFVNDASTDNTVATLEPLKIEFKKQVEILCNTTNLGKAESVRKGMNHALTNIHAVKYAFLDADLATSLKECLRIAHTVENKIRFSFGSRILTLGTDIQRSSFRHYVGRIVATAISNTLKLKVYDTQCGCKVFDRELSLTIFQDPFISRWLFDVEIFFRTMKELGRDKIEEKVIEHPLKKWIDKGESKVQFSYFFKLWLDLWKIRRKYRNI